jgi:hypothetical protein
MDPQARAQIVERLSSAFEVVQDVTPAPGQPLHLLLSDLELPTPWTPSPTRAITVWSNWPQQRPDFYIDASVTGQTGAPPRNPNPKYLLGETWNGFSFNFPWAGDDPVRAIQSWLTRFEVEPT